MHQPGAGRPATIFKSQNCQRLRHIVNLNRHWPPLLALVLGTSAFCKVIRKLKIKSRRRIKVPKYKNGAAKTEPRMTTDFLDQEKANYVEKEDNPTEVSQCRPVEDFFGFLAIRVYHRNWVKTEVAALILRIRKCFSEIPQETVQATMLSVGRKLM